MTLRILSLAIVLLMMTGCSQAPAAAPESAILEPEAAAATLELPQDEPLADLRRPAPPAAVPSRPLVAVDWQEDRLDLTLPVEVVLLGFPPQTMEDLAASFPDPLAHEPWVKVEPEGSAIPVDEGTLVVSSLMPRADLRFTAVPDPVADYVAAVARDGSWDGNAAEAWLAARLPAWRVGAGPVAPLVLLHAGGGPHTYRVELPNGHLDGVRVMGGLQRLLAIDVSANGTTPGDGPAIEPIAATDVAALSEVVATAVRFSLLAAPRYEIPTAVCHAATIVYVIVASGTTGHRSPMQPDGLLDASHVQQELASLTGRTVFVDVLRLEVPQQDATLGALLRGTTVEGVAYMWEDLPGEAAVGEQSHASAAQVHAAVRGWVDEHWADYHQPHPGCDESLALVVFSDQFEADWYGFTAYDGAGHRYGFGAIGEVTRSCYESGPVAAHECKPAGVNEFDLVNLLALRLHGALLGLGDPTVAIGADGPTAQPMFGAVQTVMSPQIGERSVQFGHLDRDAWRLNQAGAIATALDAGGLREKATQAGFLQALEGAQWDLAFSIGRETLELSA